MRQNLSDKIAAVCTRKRIEEAVQDLAAPHCSNLHQKNPGGNSQLSDRVFSDQRVWVQRVALGSELV
jgi:hypothetical protein